MGGEKADVVRRRKKQKQLFEFSSTYSSLSHESFRKNELKGDKEEISPSCQRFHLFSAIMDVNTKIWTAGIALFVLLSVLLLSMYISVYSSNEMFCVELDGHGTCHTTDKNPYRLYGTKTAYHVAVANTTDNYFRFEECTPMLFYILSRHATRYPDEEQIEEMTEVLPVLKKKAIEAFSEGKSSICEEDIKRLQLWSMTAQPDFDNKITESGKLEALNLAQRYKKRFPSVLDENYSPHRFVFEYTSRERTMSSAEAFAEGLFGKLRVRYIQGRTNDPVLQFHKDCKSYQKRCNSTTKDKSEVSKFENGKFGSSLVSSISKRLGFSVTFEEIEVMYRACVFGYAAQESDIWCSVFSRDDLRVMEYADDIDDYYSDAYGKKINYEQACPAIKYITDLVNNSTSHHELKGVFQFTHAGAIKKVYAALGLFQDSSPLTADNFCYVQDRKWRSSLIAPFTSNIAFALFQCNGQKKIAFFHNEEPVIIEGCHTYFCPIEDFNAQYKSIAENCDVSSLCCTCCIN